MMRILPPLAPDYSGASSVLFTLGGAIIINGADGCIGNVTGYDEPRFFDYSVPIFSSGLREMKAITGDEDTLKGKIENSVGERDVSFIAILGTPNSAVIASDHRGVASLLRRNREIPVFTINTTGIDTYEKGAANAYLSLASEFVRPVGRKGGVNIIGASPMDYWGEGQIEGITGALSAMGMGVNSVWGRDDSLSAIEGTLAADVNLVVSYSGLKAARWLEQRYGQPYVAGVPLGHYQSEDLLSRLMGGSGAPAERSVGKGPCILVVGDQIWAMSMRGYYLFDHGIDDVHTASFFSLDRHYATERDYYIESEKHLQDLMIRLEPDVVIADPLCRPFAERVDARFVDVPHLAVSSRIHWDHGVMYTGRNLSF